MFVNFSPIQFNCIALILLFQRFRTIFQKEIHNTLFKFLILNVFWNIVFPLSLDLRKFIFISQDLKKDNELNFFFLHLPEYFKQFLFILKVSCQFDNLNVVYGYFHENNRRSFVSVVIHRVSLLLSLLHNFKLSSSSTMVGTHFFLIFFRVLSLTSAGFLSKKPVGKIKERAQISIPH